ncbi:MAG: protein adenylyltransferase SelO [Maritimibacter sp.]
MTTAFDNSYTRLPNRLFSRQKPSRVAAPGLIIVNDALATRLGVDRPTAEIAVGNALPKGADPIAQMYAGHQFGNWAGQLGDGRAVLLGEVVAPDGARFDIQLKGAGRTPYSRGGDGRAWLGPVLREYIVSEAMFALGVPTTRALAASTTGEDVIRETLLPGAVLMRVARSHIRVGTFQGAAMLGDHATLNALTQHAISRHYPDANGALDLLRAVASTQADLIAKWMSFGFIHGVMNTDNMAISGETIDYGPCAFMDAYHPAKVFSSIDRHGRYAYQNQPQIAVWNLAQLAISLLPLIESEVGQGEAAQEAAQEAAEEVLAAFPDQYQAAWARAFGAKIGLSRCEDMDSELIQGLLSRMATSGADFTKTFAALREGDASAEITQDGAWETWVPDWRARLAREPQDPSATMRRANPLIIARNHHIQAVIEAGVAGDFAPFKRMTKALETPFEAKGDTAFFATPPTPSEEVKRTFCGT